MQSNKTQNEPIRSTNIESPNNIEAIVQSRNYRRCKEKYTEMWTLSVYDKVKIPEVQRRY